MSGSVETLTHARARVSSSTVVQGWDDIFPARSPIRTGSFSLPLAFAFAFSFSFPFAFALGWVSGILTSTSTPSETKSCSG